MLLKEAICQDITLHWDGFVLFFDLLCRTDESDSVHVVSVYYDWQFNKECISDEKSV